MTRPKTTPLREDQIERLVKYIMQRSMAERTKHFGYEGEGYMPNPEWHELHRELVTKFKDVVYGT